MKNVLFIPVAALLLFAASCTSTPEPAPAAPVEEQKPKKNSARLRAEELITGRTASDDTTAGGNAKTATGVAPASDATSAAKDEEDKGDVITTETESEGFTDEISADEKRFFERYLQRMKYLVMFKEGTAVPEAQVKAIVAKANQLLLGKGFDVVQYEQLLKNMEDQRTAYEAEAGASMSIIQYLAQKMGADVYVEVEATPESWTEGSRHYGEARFSVNMYDPSTAELLGSVAYRSDRSVSTTSKMDAQQNALVFSMGQIMDRVIRDSGNLMRMRYSNGIRYQVAIQRTPDSRAISALRRALRSRFREVRMGNSAADQTNLEVYFFGDIFDVQDTLEMVFERTPGFENTYWVYNRGKTIVFNTGM